MSAICCPLTADTPPLPLLLPWSLLHHLSNYHVELNPSDVGNNDRYVVQEVIKELARNRPLDVAGAPAAGWCAVAGCAVAAEGGSAGQHSWLLRACVNQQEGVAS
jgi:hypothetical protein